MLFVVFLLFASKQMKKNIGISGDLVYKFCNEELRKEKLWFQKI